MTESWTIGSLIEELAARGAAPAVMSLTGEIVHTLSCAELATRSRRLARSLVGFGIAPGAPAGLIAPNGPDWLVARFALGLAGAMAIAFDDLAAEPELKAVVLDAGCRTILTSAAHIETLRRIAPDLRLVVLDDDAPTGAVSWTDLFQDEGDLPTIPPEAAAMLVHTSGTTGAPKGFVLTYANLWANISAMAREKLIGTEDRVLLPLPLHHVYPLVVGVLTVLTAGSVIVFPEAVAGPQIMQAMRSGEITVLIGVPRLLAALTAGIQARMAGAGWLASRVFGGLLGASAWLRRRWGINAGRILFGGIRRRIGPKLRMLVSGGARIEPELLWPLATLGYEIRSGYGLAETSSIFTGNLPGRERLGSEGRPFAGNQLRIVGADAEGHGEIELKGPCVFSAYRDNQAANEEAFTCDGWFRTGDLGRLDQDGFLYVTGRRKETLVLGGGKKIHPEELEKLYGVSSFIKEIAVFERKGSLAALVIPDLEAIRAGGRVGIEDVIRVELAVRAQALPSYERLAGYAIAREPLPRTRLGKIQRFLLPELYEQAKSGGSRIASQALSEADQALLAQPAAGDLMAFMKARYKSEAIGPDTHPALNLGIDSLEWMALALALEERFGFRLDEEDVYRINTIRDLLRFVTEPGRAAEGSSEILTAEDRSWLTPPGPLLTLLGLAVYCVDWILCRGVFRIRARGLGNLPASGAFVLLANHESDLDPLVLAAAVGLRHAKRLFWSGDITVLFGNRALHPLLRASHVFPVDERMPSKALALAAEVLRQGSVLVWFPESWRTPDGQLQRFLPGIGKLLTTAPVPVVPLYIEGTFEALPRGRLLPRYHAIKLLFGPPVDPGFIDELDGTENCHQEIANHFRRIVSDLGNRVEAEFRD